MVTCDVFRGLQTAGGRVLAHLHHGGGQPGDLLQQQALLLLHHQLRHHEVSSCQQSTSLTLLCRSTSNSLVSTALNRSATAASVLNNSNSSNSNSSESDAVLLPCEFCDQPIPSTKLLSHQAECVSPANVRPAAATAASAGSYSSRMTRAASITRSPSYSLAATASSSRVNKVVEDSSPSPRKISPSSGSSIVSRFLSGPEPKSSGSESRQTCEQCLTIFDNVARYLEKIHLYLILVESAY